MDNFSKYHLTYPTARSGFTLIELLVSLAILGILAGVAAPSFAERLTRVRLDSHTTALFDSLALARNQAIMRQQTVHICQLDVERDECDNNYDFNRSWSGGWMIFADLNGNNNYDSSDTIIRIERLSGSIPIVFNQRGRLRFFANGTARSAGFYVCGEQALEGDHIRLLHTGRARIKRGLSERNYGRCITI